MNCLIQKELQEELSDIIKKSLNVKNDTQLENLKRDLILLDYIIGCINRFSYFEKAEKKIVKSMRKSYKELQDTMENINYEEFIKKYIQNLRDSFIGYNTNVFDIYNEHYNLIYQLLINLYNKCYDINIKKNIIDIIVEEENNREEYFPKYWSKNEYKNILTNQILEDSINYLNTNRFDIGDFNNYIKKDSRKKLIRKILSDKNIVQSLYNNMINYPCKPKLEDEEIEVFISQILNKFYINHNEDSYNSIKVLKIEDKKLKEIKTHINFKIKEEILIKIKEIYANIVENESLNQLLDSVSVAKPFKQKEDLSKINALKDNLKSIIIENDIYYLFDGYKSLSTDTKMEIIEKWDSLLRIDIYTMFNLWLKKDKVDFIFEKVYEKNKEEIKKLLTTNENNTKNQYFDYILVAKIDDLIRNTTYSVLQDNKEYIIKNINQDTINELDFGYDSGYKEKEFVINVLPEILSGINPDYQKGEEKNKLIKIIKSKKLPYKLKYKPRINTKTEIESYYYIDILKKKNKTLNSLNNNIKELGATVNIYFNSSENNASPFTSKEISTFYKDIKDFISSLYIPLSVSIQAIEKQKQIYSFIDYIEKQKILSKEENEEYWEEMIIKYFECYNIIFNNMKDLYSSEVIEKIENSPLLEEYKQAAAKLVWNYLLKKDEPIKQWYYTNLCLYVKEFVQKNKSLFEKINSEVSDYGEIKGCSTNYIWISRYISNIITKDEKEALKEYIKKKKQNN